MEMSHAVRSVGRMLRALADDLLALLLPGKCPGCGARGEPVCAPCAATMRAAPSGMPIPGVSWSVAVFVYEGVAGSSSRVKYRNERIAVRWLGAKLAQSCRRAPIPFDVVTWIPASAIRRASRGIDHGALLARGGRHRPRVAARTLALARQRSAANGPRARSGARARRCTEWARSREGECSSWTTSPLREPRWRPRPVNSRACGARDVLTATVARTPRPADRAPAAAYTRNAALHPARGGRSRE